MRRNNPILYIMKRIAVCALALLTTLLATAAPVSIETKNMTLVINVENGHQPYYIYFGKRLKSSEKDNIQHPRGGRMDIYPAQGMNAPAEAAFSMRHADGLARALDARSYEGGAERSHWHPLHMETSDWIAVGITAVYVAALILLGNV